MVVPRDAIQELRDQFLAGLAIQWTQPPPVYRPPANTAPVISLDELRERIRAGRAGTLGLPGCFLDTSPTGSGKSTADQHCVLRLLNQAQDAAGKQALIVLPSHQLCREQAVELEAAGIDAVAYPARRTEDQQVSCPRCKGKPGNSNCRRCCGSGQQELLQNCWNAAQADRAEEMGLPLMQAVCKRCEHRQQCQREGYLGEVQAASAAPVAIATHARARYSGLGEVGTGRSYISIHEDCVDLIRPSESIGQAGLLRVRDFLDELTNDPRWLKFFGSGESALEIVRRQELFRFVRHLFRVAERLLQELEAAAVSRQVHLEGALPRPTGLESFLFWAIESTNARFDNAPWRLALAAAAGEVASLGVLVNSSREKGGAEKIHKQVVGVWGNCPPPTATTIFSDATTDQETLQALLSCPVRDITPAGRLELQHQALQYVQDITRKTADKTVQSLIRGLMTTEPNRVRAGIICHSTHQRAAKNLEADFAERLEKVAYWGSGEERGSNEWYQRCDYLIILGAPRLPERQIQERLLQLGRFDALGRQPDWGVLIWEGATADGRKMRITGRGYRDADWQAAHRSLVRAAIIQAVGRGRGFLSDGIPVAVVTSEECGLRLHDQVAVRPFNDACQRVYSMLRELAAENPKYNLLRFSAANSGGIPTADICQRIGQNERTTREILERLKDFGLVQKIGERKGWLPIPPQRE